jgi:acetyltransferase-like isoleucine patch superfamily enzyme
MSVSIHPTAIVSSRAQLGENVTIGPFTVIHDFVNIGSNSRVDGFCQLGFETPLCDDTSLFIGDNSLIRSHCVVYQGSSFGPGLKTGHHVTIRENTSAGNGFQVGTYSDIQGHCNIGHHVRTHSSVTIGQKSEIGNFVWLFPGVLVTNDPNPPSNSLLGVTIEDYVVVAVRSTLLPGVRIGNNSFVAAHSLVGTDMPENSLIAGSPAARVCNASDMRLKEDVRQRAYPWVNRFSRGYPAKIIEMWANGLIDFELPLSCDR